MCALFLFLLFFFKDMDLDLGWRFGIWDLMKWM